MCGNVWGTYVSYSFQAGQSDGTQTPNISAQARFRCATPRRSVGLRLQELYDLGRHVNRSGTHCSDSAEQQKQQMRRTEV